MPVTQQDIQDAENVEPLKAKQEQMRADMLDCRLEDPEFRLARTLRRQYQPFQ